ILPHPPPTQADDLLVAAPTAVPCPPRLHLVCTRWPPLGRLPPPSLPPLSPPSVVRPIQIPGAPVPSWLARFRRCSRAAVSPVLRFAAWILPPLAAPRPACR